MLANGQSFVQYWDRSKKCCTGLQASIPQKEQSWLDYAFSFLAFNLFGILAVYALQRLQLLLPLNPQSMTGVSPDLSLNTAISFTTNTSWQSYAGETTLSYFSQMTGITVQSFLSAASGIAVAIALIRGFARRHASTIGNFWTDMVRATLYVLLPICIVASLVLIWQGVPQTLDGSVDATTLEGGKATDRARPRGLANRDQDAELGWRRLLQRQFGPSLREPDGAHESHRNGAHLFDRGGADQHLRTHDRRPAPGLGTACRHGHPLSRGNPLRLQSSRAPAIHACVHAALDQTGGNMEGKEVRFGIAASSLFATVTTDSSSGAVNAMHDSFMPLSGGLLMANMMVDEVIVGGVGSGLFGMLLFCIVTVFLGGLMVGRTPEYVGKKIQADEVKMTMLALLCVPGTILLLTSVASIIAPGLAGIANQGPHGFSEILYAYTSAAATNGSAFAGLNANTPFYNLTLALAMFLGRFLVVIPVLAIAGSLAAKPITPSSAGTLPTTGVLFITLLIGVIVTVGGLTFLPALTLGPVAEHFAMQAGLLF